MIRIPDVAPSVSWGIDIVHIANGSPIATANPTIAPYCNDALELAAPRTCRIHVNPLSSELAPAMDVAARAR